MHYHSNIFSLTKIFSFYKIKILCLFSLILLVACQNKDNDSVITAPTVDCLATHLPSDKILACYVDQARNMPLDYVLTGTQQLNGILIQNYTLRSLMWNAATPSQWEHHVSLYLPQGTYYSTALVIINDGHNRNASGETVTAIDYKIEDLAEIAAQTRSVIISIDNIPNQTLTIAGDHTAREEDGLVAATWIKFILGQDKVLPLQLPMATATIRAMDLSQHLLGSNAVKHFIITGASKRGWAAWLASIADQRVQAIIPAVIDILDFNYLLKQTHQVYAHYWPIALYDYRQAGLIELIETEGFKRLVDLIDPLAYLNTKQSNRLAIDKYILSSSGDDFFIPDALGNGISQLPGHNSLRVMPNANHGDIRHILKASLISYLQRYQHQKTTPTVNVHYSEDLTSLYFNEKPISLKQWVAVNPLTRDFRKACGIVYQQSDIDISNITHDNALILPNDPIIASGWRAHFYEATFADGFIATTPINITPKDVYPTLPSALQGACLVIP